ncbi:MAG TPA: protein-L-isoaspartate O-methyltransferase [Acetobacteraceae bacterium]|jgi:protein-L-isoaspartate(D-aspartate) O-methyltransferase
MDHASEAFAAARNHMVDSQIRPNKVNDPRIIGAMRQLPRERFLPPQLGSLAYADGDVALGDGRVLLEPAVIARLVQLTAVSAGERALVVASGTGYGAALLAACGARVTALEEVASLQGLARGILAELAPSVGLVAGPLAAGWPPGAPYDVILIEGAVREIPPGIAEQLHRETGRLVAVLTSGAGLCQAVLAEATAVGLRPQPMFDCATAPIPSLLPSPGFVF